jgi:nucleoside-diphosphate-sugar epimerase
MKILITGANGFVGSALCQHLAQQGHIVTALMRTASTRLLSNKEQTTEVIYRPEPVFGDFLDTSLLPSLLQGTQTLVHTAARVHQVQEMASNPLATYRAVNTQGTMQLAQAAAQAGVKRFVFLSSVKVNGEFTAPGQPFTASQAAPQDPYGISKWEAEQGLWQIAKQTGLEVVIIRPPLVYGPGVKANFLTMMRWLMRGIPLPLGAIHNQRSLVALSNLISLIETCLMHSAAAGQTFMASDQRDLSTTELLRLLGDALGKPARLLPVPQSLLEGGLKLIGKAGMVQRLCGSLAVDAMPATQLLGWRPVVTVEQGLKTTAKYFLAGQ